MTSRLLCVAAVSLLLFATACSGAQRKKSMFTIDASTTEGAALERWFDGAGAEALDGLDRAGGHATARWVRGEIAYFDGDVERAFDEWTSLILTEPNHLLTRYALARLNSSRDEFIDFEHRISERFRNFDLHRLDLATRALMAQLLETVDYRHWSASDADHPFPGERYGLPTRWLKTPMISPWRLTDLDEEFAPQRDSWLAPTYLSPYTAVDTALNYQDVTPLWFNGTAIHPGFAQTGIHYLETIATVPEESDYLLYGNFVSAAQVWIDGVLVLEHRETDYQPGKAYRKIRLPAGEHRVLVKLAFQAGYRDWFDLAFLPDAAGDHAISFTYRCVDRLALPECITPSAAAPPVELVGEQLGSSDLEPVYVEVADAAAASDLQLWLTMTAAYYSGDHDRFAAMWAELRERRPNFAPGYRQLADEVQTQWEIPSKLRDAQALQALRKAHELDPESVRNVATLAQWLGNKGEDREALAMLKTARDAVSGDDRLRNFSPLSAWAAYLDNKGWEVPAEQAWRDVLAADPSNCRAAQKVQSAMYGRLDYVAPEAITPDADKCPSLKQSYETREDAAIEARLHYAELSHKRNPLRSDIARNYADELVRAGRLEEGMRVLHEAYERNPTASTIASSLADRAFANGDTAAALKVLDEYQAREGLTSWIVTKRASLLGHLPLSDLMPDGLAAAKKAVADGAEKALSNDDAYFVVDFAATQYFPDNAHITLTHTVIRVMTKGAIDRYGEQNLPGDAVPILVRTIKQDGTTRVPEQTAGKSTLSMPGLAEGDFVEVAYLQYARPDIVQSHIEGVRFFFQMSDISTLHSEYVIIGKVADFVLENNAPTPEKFDYNGQPAVRFLARDNPRPRAEPRTVSGDEYLPWIQMYELGNEIDSLELLRRNVRESIIDSSKSGAAFEQALASWTSGELPPPGSEAWAREVFYRVTPLISNPSISVAAFRTDLNHIVLSKAGNPMMLLKAAYDRFGVESDVFAIKPATQIPAVSPVREAVKYGAVLLRVKHDSGESWVLPAGPDAMFGAVPATLIGQPALCITCDEPERTTVPTTVRAPHQDLAVTATLDATGTLRGRITFELQGVEASSLRAGLRSRTDTVNRNKLIDVIGSSVFPGASYTSYEFIGEHTPDEPLKIEIDFARPNFARETTPGTFQVETQLFGDAIASAFGNLPVRTTPMFVGFTASNTYRLDLTLEGWSAAELASAQGEQRFDSAFGNARRSVTLSGDKLTVHAATSLGVQRVAPPQYNEFMRWALAVEQSALTLLRLRQ